MRKFDTIVLHASATPPDWMAGTGVKAKKEEINRWHLANGWDRGFGYHFLVDRDGAVAKGRPVNTTGAHVAGHNHNTVGVCIVGGRWPSGKWAVKTDDFFDHYTKEQDAAVRKLICELCEKYPQIKYIRGHNDYTDKKGCPGFDVAQWLKGGPVKKPANKPSLSKPQTSADEVTPKVLPSPGKISTGGIVAIVFAIFAYLMFGG